jgi:putative flippase GtrA
MTAATAPARWVAFAAVGTVGFGVQLAALAWLTNRVGLPTGPAAALAVEIAVLHNFAWHEWWTWRDRGGLGWTRVLLRLARFHAATGIVSLAGNVALTVAAVAWLHFPVVLANTCAVVILSAVNFRITDRWVFTHGTRCLGSSGSLVPTSTLEPGIPNSKLRGPRLIPRLAFRTPVPEVQTHVEFRTPNSALLIAIDRTGTSGGRSEECRRARIPLLARIPAACRRA